MPKQISVVYSSKDKRQEGFVSNKHSEAQIIPELSPKKRKDLMDVFYTYKSALASNHEPSGSIKGNEVDITLNIERPYPPVIRRKAYPVNPRAMKDLEKKIQEFTQLGVP
ncbi:hypothetical protein O181_036786 [Austropuccinia psidii MF-1]|uniref:Uncharacterized protein n=1 Tax=Austropuccinia psidii MF-1 TaxID=1389203 RepID=A0A9Q3D521_9BASI|nr:hypothetical protein [Austropuccinia psidii MF-1]